MIGFEIKQLFFDREAVTSRVDPATRKVLSKFGAFVRRTAKGSIRRRRKAAPPGSPRPSPRRAGAATRSRPSGCPGRCRRSPGP